METIITIENIKNEWKNNKIYKTSILMLLYIMVFIYIIFSNEKFLNFLEKILLPLSIFIATWIYNRNQFRFERKKYFKENFDNKISFINKVNNFIVETINNKTKNNIKNKNYTDCKIYSILAEARILFDDKLANDIKKLIEIIKEKKFNKNSNILKQLLENINNSMNENIAIHYRDKNTNEVKFWGK